MNYHISHKTKTINAEITLAASKSLSNRALIIQALSSTPFKIHNLSTSKDTQLLNEALQTKSDTIDVGDSGTAFRFLTALLACKQGDYTLTGSERMKERPIKELVSALKELGADIKYLEKEGYPPLKIKGKSIEGGKVSVDASISSQFISALLLIAPSLKQGLTITLEGDILSVPYIKMTSEMMSYFGIEIQHDGFEIFHIRGNQTPSAGTYTVEGDWSGASFHAVGAAISGAVNLMGVSVDSAQADVRILEAVRRAGAKVEKIQGGVKVSKNQLRAFEFDASDCPDLFPPLAALACCCEGSSKLIGTERLVYKESNRAESIQSELKKLGIQVVLEANTMEIKGGNIFGGEVSSNDDHRIAMMAAILASVSDQPISIQKPMAVNKSYPSFYDDLEQIAP